jgi:hypothetical protein
MSKYNFIGDDIDALVEKLRSTEAAMELALDIIKVAEAENQDLQAQLFRYADDMHTLIAERDSFTVDESEKKLHTVN